MSPDFESSRAYSRRVRQRRAEIERMSCDPDWLDKAIRIVEKQIQEMNRKQKGGVAVATAD